MSIQKNDIKIAKIEEIIEDAKRGKMFILVDDENRENEGDLVIPAQFATSDVINFMAKYGRGLICLSLNTNRVKELNLPLMAQNNQSRNKTAFTVSIEAKEGVTTGISAYDRAHTIQSAIDPTKTADDIVSPGHIFPLMAKDGGVLTRAGHTEAAVDIAKIAGLNPSGVICEIMKDDGEMARLPDLAIFAKEHNLKIAKIADLINYRRKNDKLISRYNSSNISTLYGDFNLVVYHSVTEYAEHVVLIKGDITSKENLLVRMHSQNFLQDFIHSGKESDILIRSMKKINEIGNGVIVILRSAQKDSVSQAIEINNNKSENKKIRDYGIGAQILLDLDIKKLQLLTNNPKAVIGLEGYGIEITNYINV
ncbi:MAG: 3,4-dihydroxy-2-butanone-4-phosphate synthase [Rickettsiales bacterium]|nr:3,4-dihydroxy-2-butanone-4-phosphate synthase [Rickettsiales bacterium]